MHSRIFNLSDKKQNETVLCNSIATADYVISRTDIFDDWQWLLMAYGCIEGEKQRDCYTITLYKNKVERYLNEQIDEIKRLVNSLNTDNWYNYNSTLWNIKNTINDEYGFYIIDVEGELNTIDEWLRYQYHLFDVNKVNKITYIITETFDYHS